MVEGVQDTHQMQRTPWETKVPDAALPGAARRGGDAAEAADAGKVHGVHQVLRVAWVRGALRGTRVVRGR